MAPAAGWLARAERLVGTEDGERVESGYLLIAAAAQSLAFGDAATALETYEEAEEIATQFSDPDLVVLAGSAVARRSSRCTRPREASR